MTFTTKNISVLIPDGETTLLSNVVHSLSLIKSIKIYVISSHKRQYLKYTITSNSCFKHSRFIEKYVYFENTSTEAWLDKIDRTVEDYGIDLIMPIFDVTTKRILEHKHQLKHKSKLCYLSHLTDFETALRKDLLYKFLTAKNLPRPESIVVDTTQNVDFSTIKFPIVGKPSFGYQGGMRVSLLKNKDALNTYLASVKTDYPILLQQYIKGFDVSCNVLCNNGKIQAYTMQKANNLDEIQLTPQHEFTFFYDEALLELMKTLMKALNWSGVANIDFRYDQTDNLYKVIEINPRFWLNTEASALAGVNFPYLYCLMSLNKPLEFIPVKEGKFLHLKVLVKRLFRNPFLIFKFSFLRKHTPFRFVIKDPVVLWYKFIWRTNNKLSSKGYKSKSS